MTALRLRRTPAFALRLRGPENRLAWLGDPEPPASVVAVIGPRGPAGPAGESFGAAMATIECDFGAIGAQAMNFDVADADAVAASSWVLVWLAGSQPAGVDPDELEMDPIQATGLVPADGVVRLSLVSTGGGTIFGKRRIHYALA